MDFGLETTLALLATLNAWAIFMGIIGISFAIKDEPRRYKMISKFSNISGDSFSNNTNFFQFAFGLLISVVITTGLVATINTSKHEITPDNLIYNMDAVNFITKYKTAFIGVGVTLIFVEVSFPP